MILDRIRSSLLLNTTLAVLGVALVVGLAALALAGRIAGQWERAHLREAVADQMDGVESDAAAACFAGDHGLARQLVERLVATRTVRAALLRSAAAGVLAQAGRDGADATRSPQILARRINSPFQKEIQVGELVLAPDPAEAARLGERTAVLVRAVALGLTATLGLALAVTVQHSIIRPIATLSDRLHRLEAETGALLSSPLGHDRDEIGRLVWDVNALVERLVKALRHERELGEMLALDQRKMEAVLHHAGTGIFLADGAGALEAWTPAFLKMLDQEQAPPARGASFPALFGARAAEVADCLARCRALGDKVMAVLPAGHGEGRDQRWLQLCLEPIGANLVQGLLEDMTSYREDPEGGPKHALRDPLTGVLNRLGAEQALAERLAKGHGALALMLVDLDFFTRVNANYGREAGDALLRQVAARVGGQLRRSDLLARMGGDEFLVLLDGLADEGIALGIADKVIKAIGAPITLPGAGETWVGASVGIVLHDSGEPASRLILLKRMDMALEQARRDGRNRARVLRA